MKHRILKKFVKAYRPYGLSREGVLLGKGMVSTGIVVLLSDGGLTKGINRKSM